MARWVMLGFAIVLAGLPAVALAQVSDGTTTPIDSLSTFALWGIVGGALTSVVTAVLNRRHWPSDLKFAVFFALCCLTAAGNAYFNRSLTMADWSRSLLLVVASGWTTYLAAKPAIKTIEARTG